MLKVFKGHNLIVVVTLIVIHQSLIASSIIFLTKLLLAYQAGSDYKNYLFLYLSSMLLPYIPGLLSYRFLQKWINSSHYKYFLLLKNSNGVKKLSYRDILAKEKIDAVLSRNSFSIISSSLYFFHDLFTLLCNSFFSFIVIYYVLTPIISLGYVFTSIVSFLLIFFTRKFIENKSFDVEDSSIKYSNLLSKFSNNISTGNQINLESISSLIKIEGKNYYDKALNLQTIKQIINFILAMVALLPTCYLIIFTIFHDGNSQTAIVAIIIVNITRIFTLLSSLNTLLNSFIELPSLIGRLKILENILYNENNLPSKVSGFFINNIFFKDTEQMSSYLMSHKTGRFTITGENGSGKSTFLYDLRTELGYQALFIPTELNNLCWNKYENFDELSSGQRIKKILESTFEGKEKFILLDEWNANLDKTNRVNISKIIDQISQSKIVIEIIHHH